MTAPDIISNEYEGLTMVQIVKAAPAVESSIDIEKLRDYLQEITE